MDDVTSYRSRHPDYRHREVPWTAAESERLVKIWRVLLESQNGEGVDGSELAEDGGTFGAALRTLVSPGRILVLGAGRGQEVAHARARGYDAVGVTLGSMNPKVAEERYGFTPHFVDAHCSTAFEVRSFDAVLGFQVLEHSPAPLILLLESARLLRPGGLAVFETPGSAAHTGGRSLHHVLCPTARQARGLFEKAGFANVQQFCAGKPVADADLDRGDLSDLLTVGVRATDVELQLFDPATRVILGDQ